MSGNIDRLLARRGVENEQGFLRLDQITQAEQLLHKILVDLQPASGIEDQRVAVLGPGGDEGVPGNLQNVLFSPSDKNRQLDLLAQLLELLHGGRAINIGGHKQRCAALLMQQAAKFST